MEINFQSVENEIASYCNAGFAIVYFAIMQTSMYVVFFLNIYVLHRKIASVKKLQSGLLQ